LLLSYLFLVPFVFSSSLNANDEKTNGTTIILLIIIIFLKRNLVCSPRFRRKSIIDEGQLRPRRQLDDPSNDGESF